MRHVRLISFMATLVTVSLYAQTPATPPPQSARQALIEMFLGKGPDDFAKHLPDDARRALIHKGDTADGSLVVRISEIGRQMTAGGEHMETFDTGSLILTMERAGGAEKFEVNVERDSVMGEEEEIELSIHSYKNGQPESIPVIPRFIFTWKQENNIWRLTEVTVAAHMPLTDPDYLKTLRKEQNEMYEARAQMRMNIIVAAETGYAAKNPDQGYTCAMANLFTGEPAAGQEQPAAYYDPGQGSEEWNGYHFALSGCGGNPATKYRVTAVPTDSDAETKTFCSDQSGTLRFVIGEKVSSCFSQGQVLDSGPVRSETDE